MTPVMSVLVFASLAALLVISVFRFIQHRNTAGFVLQLFGLIACSALIYQLFFSSAVAKGDEVDWAFLIILYACMLLGMLFNYLYEWFSVPRKKRVRKKFDWGLFLAPVFASPVVFIPLYAAFKDAGGEGMTNAKMMIFFVAMENGFFWKAYFDGKRKEVKKQASKTTKKSGKQGKKKNATA